MLYKISKHILYLIVHLSVQCVYIYVCVYIYREREGERERERERETQREPLAVLGLI